MIKTIYFMFFICMFAVAMVACKGKSNDDFKNVSADEFEGFIGNEQIQIVDVRTVAEYSEGHIPGSLNINVLDESFSANADELLNPEQTILDAIKLVTKENHSTIPVVDAKFCLVGLITKSSLVTTLSQQYFDYTEEAQE